MTSLNGAVRARVTGARGGVEADTPPPCFWSLGFQMHGVGIFLVFLLVLGELGTMPAWERAVVRVSSSGGAR